MISALVPNQAVHGKYNLISVWFNAISKNFSVCSETLEVVSVDFSKLKIFRKDFSVCIWFKKNQKWICFCAIVHEWTWSWLRLHCLYTERIKYLYEQYKHMNKAVFSSWWWWLALTLLDVRGGRRGGRWSGSMEEFQGGGECWLRGNIFIRYCEDSSSYPRQNACWNVSIY